jgi:hypothetical protein
MIQLTSELGGLHSRLDRFDPNEIKDVFQHSLSSSAYRKPASLSALLRLARTIGTGPAVDAIAQHFRSTVHDRGGKSLLGKLPIASIIDLRWLAESSSAPDLSAALASFVT